jgi:hypothetical protein
MPRVGLNPIKSISDYHEDYHYIPVINQQPSFG